ncbi:MAG: hypothetical protein WBB76_04910 [Gaiellaceae bacterium]
MALIALFIALGGSGYAATHFNNSPAATLKKRPPKPSTHADAAADTALIKKQASKLRGPKGAKGDTGPKGDPGAKGDKGDTGAPGPFPDPLVSGKTLRGTFNIDTVAGGADEIEGESISFVFTLPSAPTAHVIGVGGSSTPECPGTEAAPAAAPGHLCLYELTITNNHNPGTDGGFFATPVTKYGTELFFHSAGAGRFYVDGTWAVTAS